MTIFRAAAPALAATVLLAACSAAAPAPSASPSPSPSPSSSTPVSVVLEGTVTQALAPVETFGWLPAILISSDGRMITQGPVDAIYPGPLLPNLLERSIDQAGWSQIVDLVRAAGLLTGEDQDPGPGVAIDLTGGASLPGGQTTHLRIVVDGVQYDIAGDPTRLIKCGATFCPAADPGTPEAFAQVWARLQDPAAWLGASVGPEQPYVPETDGILTGPPAVDRSGITSPVATWPLTTPLTSIGRPLAGDPTRRCALVSGADAVLLAPSLQQANQLTVWTDPAVEGSRVGLAVRPLLPGETDPCAMLVGT